jgi:AcrR family transcriptional regulator
MATVRRRLQPEKRRDEIVAAAERLLRRDGGKVRVDDIVRAAGAAKGTFYLYFETWDDLLATLRSKVVAEVVAAHPMPAPGEAIDWLALLNRQAVAFIDAAIEMGGLHEVLYHSDFTVRRPPPLEEDAIARFVEIVAAGQAAGDFPAGDAATTAQLLFGTIHQALDMIVAGADRKRTLAALERILRASLSRAA